MTLTWIIIIILILLVAVYIGIYNGLQKAKVHADEAMKHGVKLMFN